MQSKPLDDLIREQVVKEVGILNQCRRQNGKVDGKDIVASMRRLLEIVALSEQGVAFDSEALTSKACQNFEQSFEQRFNSLLAANLYDSFRSAVDESTPPISEEDAITIEQKIACEVVALVQQRRETGLVSFEDIKGAIFRLSNHLLSLRTPNRSISENEFAEQAFTRFLEQHDSFWMQMTLESLVDSIQHAQKYFFARKLPMASFSDKSDEIDMEYLKNVPENHLAWGGLDSTEDIQMERLRR